MKILIINGPNLNKLGTREPEIYGKLTLPEIQAYTQKNIPKDTKLTWIQSNLEGEIVEALQSAEKDFQAVIINPAGFSTTSGLAILDALNMLDLPKIEVHLSQIYQREDFRTQLLTAKGSDMIMSGLGKDTYCIAVKALILKGKAL